VKSEPLNIKYQIPNAREGMALLIILLLVAAITIIGLGFIVRGDTELLCGQNMELRADMDNLAESGLEHAKGLIMYPQDLAGEYWTGATSQQAYTGSDYYDVNVTKLSECDWQITSSAYRQVSGSRTSQSSLTAKMRLDPDVAFWSGTNVVFYPAMNIAGDVYCNGAAKNNGFLNGDCFADSLAGNPATGAVKAKTDLQLSKPTINCSILTTNFTTQTLGSDNLNTTTLSSAAQVFYRNGNLEIKKGVIINGCLAVDGNLTISGISNVINAKKNVPAIYVSGNLIIQRDATLDCNGLVFVDGRVEMPIINQSMVVTGALFADDGIRYILPDYSDNELDGIVNGDCLWVSGALNGAINFDGDGDYVDAGNSSSFNITNQITVSAFIKTNSTSPAYQGIITKGNSSWRLQKSGSSNYVEFVLSGVTNGSITSKTINLNDGNWHHVAGFYDGGSIAIYIDGIWNNSRTASGSISTNTSPVYIGGNSGAADRGFNGAIDVVRVYNTPLGGLEIAALAIGGSVSHHLVSSWYMNGGSCSTMITAAPVKAAIYHWPGGVKDRWSPAAGAFYKSITRN
jgi:hypothetical protein